MPTRALITRSMESSRGAIRYLSSGKGKILSEEERAAENVYTQKVRRSFAINEVLERVCYVFLSLTPFTICEDDSVFVGLIVYHLMLKVCVM
ncbi:hypothetical protein DVH24_013932 [Malus domestica]|uniref:Uncharacterized protein n=1 Tax=Malus domestica TaxID=3750 RepID=A0A498JDZ3_MALDO|nr:hypothetical protein DVH24_013932 [Malus domestica]